MKRTNRVKQKNFLVKMEKNRELHSRRDDMQTQNCYAQIQEIVRLKKSLQVKHDLRRDDKASKK